MVNFADCFLVKIVPSEPEFIALSTFDIHHGKSGRFLLRKKDITALLNGERPYILDTDIGSYIQMTHYKSNVHVKLTWLRQDFRNDVTGYIHHFDLQTDKLQAALTGKKTHHVEYVTEEQAKARLVFTGSGHSMLHKLCQDKLTKHALRRFFRDHFNYGQDERLVIYPDSWVKGFFFQCDRMNGGIVRHEDIVTGKDGQKHRRIYYSIHT